METKIYDQKGKETGKVTLPESVFGVPMNEDLVHQVVVSMASNMRNPIAHTKDRSEVSGGGKKPWRQKGTGRARHGSSRSPIWRGGGITFGPTKDKNYEKKINRKMRIKALYVVLSEKFRDGEILFVDDIIVKDAKTSEAKNILAGLSKIKGYEMILDKKKNSAYMALTGRNIDTERGFKNFGNILINEVRNLNPLEVLRYKFLVITQPKESLEILESKMTAKVNPSADGKKVVKKVTKKVVKEEAVETKTKKPAVKKVTK
ncbi:50S ribosomal protein L4 [Patescibacteria group bacterium]|nr:50S ribosomal protein L4 [Patescibacteria group bacterium]